MSDPNLSGTFWNTLWRQFPQHCVILGDPQTRRVVNLAAERAAVHGFYSTAQVSSWVTLMVYFGSYFDEDPQVPWAAAILRESAGASREDVLERLYSKSGDVLTEIVGEGGEYYRRALVWARAQSFETISAGDGSGSGVQQWLRKAYGRKYDALPDESLAGLLRLAEAATRRYGLTIRSGTRCTLNSCFCWAASSTAILCTRGSASYCRTTPCPSQRSKRARCTRAAFGNWNAT